MHNLFILFFAFWKLILTVSLPSLIHHNCFCQIHSKQNYLFFLGWVDDSLFIQHTEHEDGVWMNNFSQHAFTTGRRHTSKTRYKSAIHTMKVK